MAPSGVQKEKIEPEDIFVLTLKVARILIRLLPPITDRELTVLSLDPCRSQNRDFLRWPVHKPLKQSACTPLFYNAYDMRNAGACIHVSLDFPLYSSRIPQVAESNMEP